MNGNGRKVGWVNEWVNAEVEPNPSAEKITAKAAAAASVHQSDDELTVIAMAAAAAVRKDRRR